VHPSLENPADGGTRVRSTDCEFLVSARAREIVEEEGITVIGYSAILQQWQDVA
jgi:hypothetical protein